MNENVKHQFVVAPEEKWVEQEEKLLAVFSTERGRDRAGLEWGAEVGLTYSPEKRLHYVSCNLFAAKLIWALIGFRLGPLNALYDLQPGATLPPSPWSMAPLGVLPIARCNNCSGATVCDCLLSTKWFLCRWWCNSRNCGTTVCSTVILACHCIFA